MHAEWARGEALRALRRHGHVALGVLVALATYARVPAAGVPNVDGPTALALAFLAGLVTAFAARALRRVVSRARGGVLGRSEIIVPAAFFAFSSVVFGVWVLGQWPGMFLTDSITAAEEGASGHFTEWGAWVYSWYWYAFELFSRSPGLVGVVQSFVAAVGITIVAASTWGRTRHKGIVAVCIISCILIPANGVQNIFYSRDWLFGWLHAGLAISIVLPLALGKRREPSLLAFVAIVVSLAVIGTVRTEGALLILFYPLVMALTRLWRLRTAALCFLVAASLFQAETHSLKKHLAVAPPASRKYEATAFLNLAGSLISTAYYSRDRDADKADLSGVVDFEHLGSTWGPYELPILWSGGVRSDFTDEEFKAFTRRTTIIALDNPALTIGFRSITFFATLGFSSFSLRYCDLTPKTLNVYSGHEARLAAMGIHKAPLVESLATPTDQVASGSAAWTRFPAPAMILWNSAPGLLLCIWALFQWRTAPRTAGAAFLILSRVPVVWLFSPACQFKYLYSVFLYGFFVIPLWLAERGNGFDVWEALRRSLPWAPRRAAS